MMSLVFAAAMTVALSGAPAQDARPEPSPSGPMGPAFQNLGPQCITSCARGENVGGWQLVQQQRQLVSRLIAEGRCDDARDLAKQSNDSRSIRRVERQCPVTSGASR